MGTSVTVEFETDSDGFISQECPACFRKFKVVFGDGSDRRIGYCPYCKHAEEGCWWTQEQADYLAAIGGEKLAGPLLDDFARKVNRISQPGDFLQIGVKVEHGPQASRPSEPDDQMQIATFACCGETVKHDGATSPLTCIICGELTSAG